MGNPTTIRRRAVFAHLHQGTTSSRTSPGLTSKANRIEELLTMAYGDRVWSADMYISDLVGALLATILSQNTSDVNSGRAYASLKAAFPGGWDDVRRAPVDAVAEAIRVGGLANVKAPRLQTVLQSIYERFGATDLEGIRAWDDASIRQLLLSLPGVGEKTAACLLMFNLGRAALPVDTHVHRVARRLGLIGHKVSASRAHGELRVLLHERSLYSFHVHMIEHGRRICHARTPICAACPLATECDWYLNRGQTA
ncbi:MAG: endonuclease III domain-containing protein [Capsulimonadaceae bacterium]